MNHRHLNHAQYTLAALDDIVSRGKVGDWLALRDAVREEPAFADKIQQVCQPRLIDPYAQRYHFWAHYVRNRSSH
jgi:hypothetical protein